MITHSASPSGTGERTLLSGLAQAARRVRTRRVVRAAAWLCGASCALLGLHLMLVGAQAPQGVVVALRPLLLLAALGVVMLFLRTITRPVDLSVVAAELDARAGLKDEIKTAWWFASQSGHSAWQALLIRRAADTLEAAAPVATLPIRPSMGPVLAAALGALALCGGLTLRWNSGPGDADDTRATADVRFADPRRNTAGETGEDAPESGRGLASDSGGSSRSASPKPSDRRADAAAHGNGQGQTGVPEGAQPAPVAAGAMAPGAASPPPSSTGVVSGGSVARAPDLSVDVASGVLQRLQSALGLGGKENERAELGDRLESPLAGGQADTAPRNAPEKENTTLDAFTEALRGLTKTPDGDQPMLNAGSPGNSPQGGGAKTTITGGASGMRVNLSDSGDGGTDTPPDAPLSEPQSVQGTKTERLAMQLNRLSTGPSGERSAGESEGFYAASQAQAARGETMAGAVAVRGATETARSDERVPLAYRNVVKRYFLNEHGRRP